MLSSCEEDESKKHASGTLLVLERTITPEMESCYEILRELVHAVNPSPQQQQVESDNNDNGNGDSMEVDNSKRNRANAGNSNDNEDAGSDMSGVVNAAAV